MRVEYRCDISNMQYFNKLANQVDVTSSRR